MRAPTAPLDAPEEWKRADAPVPSAPAGVYAPLALDHPAVDVTRCHSALPDPTPLHDEPLVTRLGGFVHAFSKLSEKSSTAPARGAVSATRTRARASSGTDRRRAAREIMRDLREPPAQVAIQQR